MGKVEIIAIIFAVTIIAFRLYQKYIKKEKPNNSTDQKASSDISGSPSADDDYEPYANK